MTAQTKLVVDAPDLDRARSVAGCFGELLDPLAVTVFEAALPKHRIEAYFPAGALPSCADVAALLAGLGLDLEVRAEPVPDENWVAVAQAALPPVVAGRFIVYGQHDAERVGRRVFGVRIDAGEAFGTAHHATTLGCLEALQVFAYRHRADRILDLGSGTGILAIAAARLFPRSQIIASDIDPVATAVATANVRLNGAAQRIRCITAEGVAGSAFRQPFGLVVANILAGPLLLLAPDIRRIMRPQGHAILSGILPEQAAQVIAAWRAQGFRLVERRDLTGWSILRLQRGP
jgi:ribosomal protein L11 methyltransferase